MEDRLNARLRAAFADVVRLYRLPERVTEARMVDMAAYFMPEVAVSVMRYNDVALADLLADVAEAVLAAQTEGQTA